MNNKLAQLVYLVNKIDRRHIQFASFVIVLLTAIVIQGPSDGGTGPFKLS